MSFLNTDYATNQMIDEAWWGKQSPYKDPKQLELGLVQFFPLTEQIALNFSFEGCDTKPNITTSPYIYNGTTDGIRFTTVATNIALELTINPIDSVGQLSIGSIRVGLEKKPSWLQRRLHKLLGFNWKDQERPGKTGKDKN